MSFSRVSSRSVPPARQKIVRVMVAEPRDLPRLEDVLEQSLPLLLLFPGEDSGNDFPSLQHLAHMRRVEWHIRSGRHAAALGEELLGLPAEDEVGRQQRGLGMRRLRADANR